MLSHTIKQSSGSSHASAALSFFLLLPLELRNQIYAHYLAPSSRNKVLSVSHNERSLPAFLPPLAVTSPQLLREVSRVLLHSATNIVLANSDAVDYLAKFLESLGRDEKGELWAFNLIHAFELRSFESSLDTNSARNLAADLLLRCPNVDTLTLTFDNEHLYSLDTKHTLKPRHEIIQELCLGAVMQCASLRHVRLVWAPYYDYVCNAPIQIPNPEDCLEGVRDIGLWVQEGFSARGPHIEVVLVVTWFIAVIIKCHRHEIELLKYCILTCHPLLQKPCCQMVAFNEGRGEPDRCDTAET